MGKTVVQFYFSRGSAARQAKIAHFYTFLLVRVVFFESLSEANLEDHN
jgi:hypothetical protein